MRVVIVSAAALLLAACNKQPECPVGQYAEGGRCVPNVVNPEPAPVQPQQQYQGGPRGQYQPSTVGQPVGVPPR